MITKNNDIANNCTACGLKKINNCATNFLMDEELYKPLFKQKWLITYLIE